MKNIMELILQKKEYKWQKEFVKNTVYYHNSLENE